MKIKEIIKKKRMYSEVTEIKKCSCIRVGYINKNESREETELTIETNPLTKAGMNELENLFASLVKEFNTTINSVNDLTIVASADTKEQLENMGF